MRNRGYSKKFLASGRALLSMLATAAVILGGLVFLPREIRAKEKEFKGFGNHGAAISEDGRYYSNGYFEKTNNGLPDREKKQLIIVLQQLLPMGVILKRIPSPFAWLTGKDSLRIKMRVKRRAYTAWSEISMKICTLNF